MSSLEVTIIIAALVVIFAIERAVARVISAVQTLGVTSGNSDELTRFIALFESESYKSWETRGQMASELSDVRSDSHQTVGHLEGVREELAKLHKLMADHFGNTAIEMAVESIKSSVETIEQAVEQEVSARNPKYDDDDL